MLISKENLLDITKWLFGITLLILILLMDEYIEPIFGWDTHNFQILFIVFSIINIAFFFTGAPWITLVKTKWHYHGILFLFMIGNLFLTNPVRPGTYTFLRLSLIIIAIIIYTTATILLMRSPLSTHIPVVKKICKILGPWIILFLVFEAIFLFVPRSHGVGLTLSAKIWFQKYWAPINELNYRDISIESKKKSKKKSILVIGDSFVSGHGIEDISERFSDILDKSVSQSHRVYNMGVNGSDTKDELQRLKTFPINPDIIVLSYFGNDIEGSAIKHGKQPFQFFPYKNLPVLFSFFVSHSYFLNYLYWGLPRNFGNNYYTFLQSSYQNELILKDHLNDLQQFINYHHDKEVPLLVIIFPFLHDLQKSEIYIHPISQFFDEQKIPIINVKQLIDGKKTDMLVVNGNDAHPNAFLNRQVARSTYTLLVELGLLSR